MKPRHKTVAKVPGATWPRAVVSGGAVTMAARRGAPTAGKQTDDNRLALRFGAFETVRCINEMRHFTNVVQQTLNIIKSSNPLRYFITINARQKEITPTRSIIKTNK